MKKKPHPLNLVYAHVFDVGIKKPKNLLFFNSHNILLSMTWHKVMQCLFNKQKKKKKKKERPTRPGPTCGGGSKITNGPTE